MILEAVDHDGSDFSDELRDARAEANPAAKALSTYDIAGYLANPSTLNTLASEINQDAPGSFVIGATAASVVLQETREYDFLTSAFILHLVALKHITIAERRYPLVTFEEEFEAKIVRFIDMISEVLHKVSGNKAFSGVMKQFGLPLDLIDIFDGRMFRRVVQEMLNGRMKNIPESLNDDWILVFDLVVATCGKSLIVEPPKQREVINTDAANNASASETAEASVLAFSDPVFDTHLSAIHVDVDESLSARLQAMKLYRDSGYWQAHKKPVIIKPLPEVKVSKWKNPLRKNQFYMAEMTSYAASLTGSNGRALEPETITVGVKKAKDDKLLKHGKVLKSGTASPASEDSGPAAKKGGKKGAVLSKKDQIIAANNAKKGDTESDKAFSAWAAVMKVYNEIPSNQTRYLRARDYRNSLDSTKRVHVEADVSLYMCQALVAWWAQYCVANKKPEGYHVVALLWTVIRELISSKYPVPKDAIRWCELMGAGIGIMEAVGKITIPTVDRKLSFKFKEPTSWKVLKIELTQAEFQLLHCGPYMDRELDAKPDSRVANFTPDGWQRRVLDELDADNSVFVVAPTSAGKTFISFYAMEQVLRANNDDILIYVAPTKALVNQIAAEVHARFSKKYPQAGKTIWAIHTREFKINNPIGCQILVTVPHILQSMLLSPTNARSWSTQVKRIIFDEIHCIGTAEDGVVWEQLLLLAPCPIVALSATVGNPEQFSDWLAETQKSSGIKLSLIQHTTRYSDLRKFLFTPPEGFKFNGLSKTVKGGLGLDGLTGLSFLHPVASLQHRSRGLPHDLALEPRDCLILWQAMHKLQTAEFKLPSDLDPAKALPESIKKADIFKWEKKLKAVLVGWMQDEKSPFIKLVEALSPAKPARAALTESEKPIALNDLKQTTLPLLFQLHQRGALPAILFNYDRTECEDIGIAILDELKAAEDTFKESPEWKRKIAKWTEWKTLKDKKAAKKAPKASKKKGDKDDDEKGSKEDQARDDAGAEVSSMDLFDPEEPQEDYSFADKRRAQRSEIDRFLGQLRWKNIRPEFIELIQRGVGVHHSGMNKKYRQCVEILFRKGYLRVIVATGELSLGINMPCATVVFSGDSVYLNALNFRQAAGRAGRRGFDLLGNVVFQNIDMKRASNLLSSRLPDLTGHFPITTDLVLRLFTLLNDSKKSEFAKKTINGLLSQDRLYLGGKSQKEQMLYHLRFTIEYLRRQNLLGPKGEPVNFAGPITHLYFTENSSWAFHTLLKDGYLADVCANFDEQPDAVIEELLLTFSHIFGRRPARVADSKSMATKIEKSQSMVYLPPMPKGAADILLKHNAETLKIFTTYVKTFSEQYGGREDNQLPLSHYSGGVEKTKSSANGGAKVDEKTDLDFLNPLPAPNARSAFVALSGHGDSFSTVSDLCSSSRQGVFLEEAIIPHLDVHSVEARQPLNAYVLDFFNHGDLKALEKANGIRREDVWFVLNDFSMVLGTICASLAVHLGLVPRGRDADDELLNVMGQGDDMENDKDEEEAAQDATILPKVEAVQTVGTPHSQPKKRGKVEESWNDAEDKLEEAERVEEVLEERGTEDEEYERLMAVYRAISGVRKAFDEKFKVIWA